MNILFVGKPGSGKGTLTNILKEDGFLQLSTGDLLRAEQERGTELGKEIALLLAGGNFATDETIFALVDKFLKENSDKSIIFDGFPRNKKQAEECIRKGIVFDHAFLIDVSDELVKDRIVNRRIHLASGRVYNLKTMPPKNEGLDDVTGEALSHRSDDHLNVLDKRLQNYRELTEPVLSVLKNNNYQVNIVDGSKEISEQIKEVKDALNNNLSKKIKPAH